MAKDKTGTVALGSIHARALCRPSLATLQRLGIKPVALPARRSWTPRVTAAAALV